MNAKLKLLSVVLAVIICVVVLSDSPANIQQIMGIIIAIMILHFYLTRHFDDVIGLSKESIVTKTDKFKIDKPFQAPLEESKSPEVHQQCDVVNKESAGQLIAGVTADIKDQQTDPYFQTAGQGDVLRTSIKTPSDQFCKYIQAHSNTNPKKTRVPTEFTFDSHMMEQGLARKPENNIRNQYKMLKNHDFFNHYMKDELDRAEARVWYEDVFICGYQKGDSLQL